MEEDFQFRAKVSGMKKTPYELLHEKFKLKKDFEASYVDNLFEKILKNSNFLGSGNPDQVSNLMNINIDNENEKSRNNRNVISQYSQMRGQQISSNYQE